MSCDEGWGQLRQRSGRRREKSKVDTTSFSSSTSPGIFAAPLPEASALGVFADAYSDEDEKTILMFQVGFEALRVVHVHGKKEKKARRGRRELERESARESAN